MTMKKTLSFAFSVGMLMLLPAGCDKKDNSDMNYKTAINDHYKAKPVCLWSDSKKLPAQAATSDDAKTEGYDALTQAGLLTRTTAEKKVLIIASKQVNNYDLSDTGKNSWTPDSSQPGYGNFCYGHREVTSIDNSTPGTNASGLKTVAVNYHYKLADVPGWANNADIKTAFPDVSAAVGANPADTATLTMNGDQWVFSGK